LPGGGEGVKTKKKETLLVVNWKLQAHKKLKNRGGAMKGNNWGKLSEGFGKTKEAGVLEGHCTVGAWQKRSS